MASNSYTIKGTIRTTGTTKQVSDKFSKREFILDVADGKYPQVVALEMHGDKCSALDSINAGDEVSVEFNVRGREWKSPSGEVKFFTTLAAWKVDVTNKSAAPSPGWNGGGGTNDGLPF